MSETPSRTAGTDAGAVPSLFGPDSVTWRVHAEPLMGLAVLRSLLLECLHPVEMAALDGSRWGRDVWDRLAAITEHVAVVTFGSSTVAMLIGSRLRAVHAGVEGTTADGVPYSAQDPQLLAWVHCCLVASFLELTTRGGLRLSPADQDAYIGEQVRAAVLVGLEPDEVPHDRAGLRDYFRVIRPALEATPGALRTARSVVLPALSVAGAAGGGARPPWSSAAGLAFAALPRWSRRLYGLHGLPGIAGVQDAGATAGLRAVRVALADPGVTPASVHECLRPFAPGG